MRVLVIDSHEMMRASLCASLRSRGRFGVVMEASDEGRALALARSKEPDVIVLDPDLGGERGLDLIRLLLNESAKSRVLILTARRDDRFHVDAMRAGACGVITTHRTLAGLARAIGHVFSGGTWIEPSLLTRLVSGAPTRASALTRREREVVSLAARGDRNKEISKHLSIAQATVRNHLWSVFRKLGISARAELATYSCRPPEPFVHS